MNIFCERLRLLRGRARRTQQSVADDLDISRGLLGNYELGSREPDFKMLLTLAEYYGVSTDYLLGRTNMFKNECQYTPLDEEAINKALCLEKDKSKIKLIDYIEYLKSRE
ncbi:MAG: helix-turn-helix domain-containing protein [Oscillospiraceae bacterium]|nr:helix-turn-helix domain-containing protein [Oscillospiraceae bacterium]